MHYNDNTSTLDVFFFFQTVWGSTYSTFTMLMKPLYACCVPFRQPAGLVEGLVGARFPTVAVTATAYTLPSAATLPLWMFFFFFKLFGDRHTVRSQCWWNHSMHAAFPSGSLQWQYTSTVWMPLGRFTLCSGSLQWQYTSTVWMPLGRFTLCFVAGKGSANPFSRHFIRWLLIWLLLTGSSPEQRVVAKARL